MHIRLMFALALASSLLCAEEPANNDPPVPDSPAINMTEEQKLNNCLLRSAQTANGNVTPVSYTHLTLPTSDLV